MMKVHNSFILVEEFRYRLFHLRLGPYTGFLRSLYTNKFKNLTFLFQKYLDKSDIGIVFLHFTFSYLDFGTGSH